MSVRAFAFQTGNVAKNNDANKYLWEIFKEKRSCLLQTVFVLFECDQMLWLLTAVRDHSCAFLRFIALFERCSIFRVLTESGKNFVWSVSIEKDNFPDLIFLTCIPKIDNCAFIM